MVVLECLLKLWLAVLTSEGADLACLSKEATVRQACHDDGEGIDFLQASHKNATLNPPDNCPVTAIMPRNLPSFLHDLQYKKLCISCAVHELCSNSNSL